MNENKKFEVRSINTIMDEEYKDEIKHAYDKIISKYNYLAYGRYSNNNDDIKTEMNEFCDDLYENHKADVEKIIHNENTMVKHNLKSMPIHSHVDLELFRITRVPNGWIYKFRSAENSSFVPE